MNKPTSARELLTRIFMAGVKAVAPEDALRKFLRVEGHTLIAAGEEYDLQKGNVYVVGAGKGAAPMAVGLEELLGDYIKAGIVVVKYDHTLPGGRIEQVEASHPVPDAAGEAAAHKILELAKSCTSQDLLICLFTGGASALLPAPAGALSLADIQEMTSLLLASGAPIESINAIRKHLSVLSGGQLARACKGRVLAIIVSDVIGDDLAAIASGPTAPDATTYADCLEIINRYNLRGKTPPSVLRVLEYGARDILPETPKPDDPCFARVQNIIVASNQLALQGAAACAESMGLETLADANPMTGEASEMAARLASRAQALQAARNSPAPLCLLAGGETTVQLRGNGKGGRNQEMALAAALALDGASGISCLFAGTDGTDGPTDAAGGFAFPDSVQRMGGLARAREFLAQNDSYQALQQAGDLFITGPTRTNVMDLAILLIESCS